MWLLLCFLPPSGFQGDLFYHAQSILLLPLELIILT